MDAPDARYATVTVEVPATTANLGPGFDALGMALSFGNRLTLTAQGWTADPASMRLTFSVEGQGNRTLPRNRDNLVIRAAERVFSAAGRYPADLQVRLRNSIPLARGLGSSAATAVAGLLAATCLLGEVPDNDAILRQAAVLEGHIDNAAAALLGGVTLATLKGAEPAVFRIDPPAGLAAVVVIPAFTLKTADARKALPRSVLLVDAVHNLSRAAFVWSALERADFGVLRWAMSDRLHQQYRAGLIPGFDAVCSAGVDAGSIAAVLSGAGPTIIAFVAAPSHSDLPTRVGKAMVGAFRSAGVSSRFLVLAPTSTGAVISNVERRL